MASKDGDDQRKLSRYDLHEAKTHEVDNYANRKNYAKGLVDLSLLTANANQLAKQYREAGGFNFACFLLTASMGFQVLHFDL